MLPGCAAGGYRGELAKSLHLYKGVQIFDPEKMQGSRNLQSLKIILNWFGVYFSSLTDHIQRE